MRTAAWVVIVSLLAAPSLRAAEPHPLKVWLMQNEGKAEHNTIEEKKSPSQAKRKAIAGAIFGALALGARAAILHQDVATAMVAGAVAGGTAGYVIGKRQDRQIADRSQLEQRVAYNASRGVVAEVTRMECSPCRVKPGDTVTITVSYYAIRPERSDLTISRHLGIAVGGDYQKVFTFDPDPFTLAEGGGEFETTFEYPVPKQMKEGTYTFDWLVDSADASVEKAGTANIVVSNAA